MKRDKRRYSITFADKWPHGKLLRAWVELTRDRARQVYGFPNGFRCRVTGEAKANVLATAMRMRGLTVEVKTYTKRRRKK